jgi:hypothetical protein
MAEPQSSPAYWLFLGTCTTSSWNGSATAPNGCLRFLSSPHGIPVHHLAKRQSGHRKNEFAIKRKQIFA